MAARPEPVTPLVSRSLRLPRGEAADVIPSSCEHAATSGGLGATAARRSSPELGRSRMKPLARKSLAGALAVLLVGPAGASGVPVHSAAPKRLGTTFSHVELAARGLDWRAALDACDEL